jgi:CRP-like cAMP-binding protein
MSKLTADARTSLRNVAYLAALSPREFASLAERCELMVLQRQQTLFAEGDAPLGVFLILTGRVRLVRSSPQGREQVLHEEGPGATLGEVPTFDGNGYVGSALAVDDATLVLVPRAPLLAALAREPRASTEVIRVLAARVRKFAALAAGLGLRDVIGRLAVFLLEERDRTGQPRIELPRTRDELAAHLGTVREQASRALSELKRQRLIEVDGRKVRILAPDLLKILGS